MIESLKVTAGQYDLSVVCEGRKGQGRVGVAYLMHIPTTLWWQVWCKGIESGCGAVSQSLYLPFLPDLHPGRKNPHWNETALKVLGKSALCIGKVLLLKSLCWGSKAKAQRLRKSSEEVCLPSGLICLEAGRSLYRLPIWGGGGQPKSRAEHQSLGQKVKVILAKNKGYLSGQYHRRYPIGVGASPRGWATPKAKSPSTRGDKTLFAVL